MECLVGIGGFPRPRSGPGRLARAGLLVVGVALVVALAAGVAWAVAVTVVAPNGSAAPGSASSARPMPRPTPESASGKARAAGPASGISAAPGVAPFAGGAGPSTGDRAVARTAWLNLTVSDLPSVATQVRALATSVGGFVASERSAGPGETAEFTLRVPEPRLAEVLGRLSGAGQITGRGERADDVTGQLADLDGRVAATEASVGRVRALLARATAIGDVISLESELTQREAELDSLRKRQAAVRDQVAMATLTVQLTPAPAPPGIAPGGFLTGLAAGWHALFAAARVGLLVLGAATPFVGLLAVLVGLWLAGRRLVRRRRAASASPASNGG